VSENDILSLCSATTKVAEKVRKAWGDLRKQCGRDMLGQTVPDRRRWTYDGHSATVRKQIDSVSGPRN